jgi:ABC-type uncharacterized transport system auxiliary subunit
VKSGRLRLGCALLALAASGCAGSPPPPADSFHRLAVPPPAVRPAVLLAGVVEVERLRASDLLRGRALVLASADQPDVLRRSTYHYWVDAPPVLLQDALVAWLRAGRLAERAVTAETGDQAQWSVAGRVQRFERRSDGQTSVALELSLRRGREPDLLVQGVYEASRKADGDSMEAAVEALGAATGAAFTAFATEIESALTN